MQTLFDRASTSSKPNVTERIKTFEDACNELGIDKLQFDIIGMDADKESVASYIQLIIISNALNEGWKPDWSNDDEPKYVPWFEHEAGFGLSYYDYGYRGTIASVGSRLCYKSAALAEYAGKQFRDIYNNYLSIK